MKIAMTGSSGYLAGVLLPLLESDSEVTEIVGIDVKPRNDKFKKLREVTRDIRDPEMTKDFAGCDILVHLAFIVMPMHGDKAARNINIEGSKNVFQAAVKAGIKKIVYTSSCAAYGAWPDNSEIITEDSPRRGMPDFYYSWTKAKVEEYLDQFEKNHPGIVITRLRACIFVGPTVNNLASDILKLPVGFHMIDHKLKFQLVWDEDVANALHLAIKKNYHGAYNLSGDGYITLDDFWELMHVPTLPILFMIVKAGAWLLWNLRIPLIKNLSPGWLDMGAYPIIMTCEKADKEMGWKASLDSKAVLARMVREVKELKAKSR
jgi:UDP-glucose 4-epimerase